MSKKEKSDANFNAKIKITPGHFSRRATTSGAEFVDLFHASLADANRSKTGRVPKDVRDRARSLDKLMTQSLSGDPKLLKAFIENPLKTFEKIAGKTEPEFLRIVKDLRKVAEKQTASEAAMNELKPGSIEVSFGTVRQSPPKSKSKPNSNPKRKR